MNLNPVGRVPGAIRPCMPRSLPPASVTLLASPRPRAKPTLSRRQAVDGFVARFLARWRQQAKIEMGPAVEKRAAADHRVTVCPQ